MVSVETSSSVEALTFVADQGGAAEVHGFKMGRRHRTGENSIMSDRFVAEVFHMLEVLVLADLEDTTMRALGDPILRALVDPILRALVDPILRALVDPIIRALGDTTMKVLEDTIMKALEDTTMRVRGDPVLGEVQGLLSMVDQGDLEARGFPVTVTHQGSKPTEQIINGIHVVQNVM